MTRFGNILTVLLVLTVSCRREQESPAPLQTRDGKKVEAVCLGGCNLYPSDIPSAPKAPRGYKVCYLSHYGRHGSRYLGEDAQYRRIHDMLLGAHTDGKLNPLGEDVLDRYLKVYPELIGHAGELTPLGQEQHKEIATRMVSNYPALFRKGSKIVVRSTNLERTMLSMNAFTNRLCELKPGLEMDIDASHLEMNYLNPHSKDNPKGTAEDHLWRSVNGPWRPAFNAYRDSVIDGRDFVSRLFNDMDYACYAIDPVELETDLYQFSAHLPGCPVEQVGFFDLYDKSELDQLAKADQAVFYIEKSRIPDPRARGCNLSESLLNDFIVKTEEDLENGVKLRLRFGHDGCLMALWALMEIEGWDQKVTGPDDIWEVWKNNYVTMAANMQLVFYRKGKNLIFTPLVNEKQIELPLESAGPYFYRWEDFVQKYSKTVEQACRTLDN